MLGWMLSPTCTGWLRPTRSLPHQARSRRFVQGNHPHGGVLDEPRPSALHQNRPHDPLSHEGSGCGTRHRQPPLDAMTNYNWTSYGGVCCEVRRRFDTSSILLQELSVSSVTTLEGSRWRILPFCPSARIRILAVWRLLVNTSNSQNPWLTSYDWFYGRGSASAAMSDPPFARHSIDYAGFADVKLGRHPNLRVPPPAGRTGSSALPGRK